MKIQRRISRQPRVEMLPLIDIVFLLLIFFIYAMLSMAVHRGLDLDLPESSSTQPTKEEQLSISVKHQNNSPGDLLILVNETEVNLADLGTKLQNMRPKKDNAQALIFAQKTISYQELFLVLDQVKEGGIEKISLQADKVKERK